MEAKRKRFWWGNIGDARETYGRSRIVNNSELNVEGTTRIVSNGGTYYCDDEHFASNARLQILSFNLSNGPLCNSMFFPLNQLAFHNYDNSFTVKILSYIQYYFCPFTICTQVVLQKYINKF
jgi:hypothetical protein